MRKKSSYPTMPPSRAADIEQTLAPALLEPQVSPGTPLPLDLGYRYLLDPAGFAADVLGWTPDAKQREALNHPGSRVILNWARQCGKSTVCAAKALHTAAVRPRSLTLVLGGVENHLAEFFAKIDHFVHSGSLVANADGSDAVHWVGGPVTGQPGKRFARRFPNGSRIAGVTTSTAVRGHSANLLILDEAGFIADAVWESVLPTLAATRGSVWVVGTPNGARGWYHDLWTMKNDTTWLRSIYPASQNSRISAEFLEEVRRMRGDAVARQEFGCEFVHNGKTLLHAEDVKALFVSDRKPLP